MTPIRFGSAQRELAGFFHAADPRRASGRAALLCNPFGHEAMRSHRFYRLLADRLSRQGVAVLRFDYYGTGDSQGDDEDGDLEGWAQDIVCAQQELLRRSGAAHSVWFGARLGARLALLAAPGAAPGVSRLVLWDTVFDGRGYLQELGRAQVDELEQAFIIPDPGWRRALANDPLAFAGESLGFAISKPMQRQLLALAPELGDPLAPGLQLSLMAPPGDHDASRWAARARAQSPGATIGCTTFQHPLIWTSNPFANNEMVPAQALQKMMSEIHGHQ